jgi:hypothetical protein
LSEAVRYSPESPVAERFPGFFLSGIVRYGSLTSGIFTGIFYGIPYNSERSTVMPRIAKPLSDTEIRTAKPSDKPYKLTDGAGLYLIIQPVGSKLWRLDYSSGKRKTLSLGAYPAVSLKEARERRDEAKKLLANGIETLVR